jgi:hypothetical protein
MNIDKKALIELLKSTGRAVYFGVLGVLSTVLVALAADADLLSLVWTLGEISLPVGVWIAAGIAGLVKAIDRYIHKSGSDANGIAPKFLQ